MKQVLPRATSDVFKISVITNSMKFFFLIMLRSKKILVETKGAAVRDVVSTLTESIMIIQYLSSKNVTFFAMLRTPRSILVHPTKNKGLVNFGLFQREIRALAKRTVELTAVKFCWIGLPKPRFSLSMGGELDVLKFR